MSDLTLNNLRARVAELEAERDRLRETAQALVTKLQIVHDDTRYMGVWQLSQAHFGKYTGPDYVDELAALRAALAGEEKP
jgi:hypothetical protein